MGGRSRLLLLVKPREALPTAMPAARCRLPAISSAAVAGASAPPVPCAASPSPGGDGGGDAGGTPAKSQILLLPPLSEAFTKFVNCGIHPRIFEAGCDQQP